MSEKESGPPAAEIVSKSHAQESDAAELIRAKEERDATKAQLDAEKAARKQEQIRIAELEDLTRQLKTLQKTGPDPRKAEKQKRSFWDSGTVLDDDTED